MTEIVFFLFGFFYNLNHMIVDVDGIPPYLCSNGRKKVGTKDERTTDLVFFCVRMDMKSVCRDMWVGGDISAALMCHLLLDILDS